MAHGDDRAYARAPRPEDVARVCRALNAAGARYVLIGGFAVIAHGAVRTTQDIDLLIDDAPDNVRLVKGALDVLADRAAREVRDEDVRTYMVVRIADEIVVDLMGQACGVRYEDAVADTETVEIEGVPVPIAGTATLIRTKQTDRASDIADRQFLEALLRGRSSSSS